MSQVLIDGSPVAPPPHSVWTCVASEKTEKSEEVTCCEDSRLGAAMLSWAICLKDSSFI